MKDATDKIGIKTQSLVPALSQDEQKAMLLASLDALRSQIVVCNLVDASFDMHRGVEEQGYSEELGARGYVPEKLWRVRFEVTLERPEV